MIKRRSMVWLDTDKPTENIKFSVSNVRLSFVEKVEPDSVIMKLSVYCHADNLDYGCIINKAITLSTRTKWYMEPYDKRTKNDVPVFIEDIMAEFGDKLYFSIHHIRPNITKDILVSLNNVVERHVLQYISTNLRK